MASDETTGYSLEDILQLIDALETGAGSQNELLEWAVRLGHISDQVKNLTDVSLDAFARFIGRMTQSIVNPGSPGYLATNQSLKTMLQTLESLVQMALDLLCRRELRYALLAMHILRIITDRNASVYSTFDHRRAQEADCEGVPVPQNHWATHLRRNSFCYWLDPEGTYQATKVLSFSHHRPLIEIQSQRFGALVSEKAIPIMSPFLSSFDTALPEPIEEWRQSLTVGSKVDCIDHIGKWYTAQIVAIQQPDGLVQVSYDGWASAYNEWLPRTSARLQPHLSVAVGGRPSSGVEVLFPEEWRINDSKDSNEYAVYRGPMMGGDLLPHVVTYFAEADGFRLLCKRIQTAPQASLEEIRSVAFILRQTAPVMSKAYANEVIGDTCQVLFDRIIDLNDIEMRPLSKEFLNEFVVIIRTPLLRISSKVEIARRLDEFELAMALKRFRSHIVERQLNGMEFLHDTMHICKNRDAYNRSNPSAADCGWAAYRWQWLDSKAFIKWMDDNGVWEDAFGENAHPQLMKRASELLRFICSEGQMTTDHLDLIWNAIKRSMRWQDESATQILYTVLDEIAFDLSDDHVSHLLQLVSEVDQRDYVVHTLDMIRRLHRDDSTALNLMWKAMQNGSSELSREARIRLEKMLQLSSQPSVPMRRPSMTLSDKSTSKESIVLGQRIKFVVLATRNIPERISVIQNMKFVQNVTMSLRNRAAFDIMLYKNTIMNSAPGSSIAASSSYGGCSGSMIFGSSGAAPVSGGDVPDQHPHNEDLPPLYSSRAELLDWLVSHCQLVKSVFDELVAFVGSAQELVQSKAINVDSDEFDKEEFHQSGCTFMENLKIRLGFLNYILSESTTCISSEQIDILWGALFIKAISARQKDLAFQWFQEIIDGVGSSCSNSRKCTLDAVNHLFINKLCSMEPSNVSQAAYACIEHYFFRVNAAHAKISGPPFQVVAQEPDGIDFIWKLLLETTDRKVSCSIIALLNQLYCDRRLDYITDIMRRMTDFIGSCDLPRIRRLLRLISHLMADCAEIDSQSFSHSRLLTGLNGDNSSITFRITCSGTPTFVINQPTRASLHWLRKTIASKIGAEVHRVRMFLNGAELSLLEDDRSIGEICNPVRSNCDVITPKKKRQKRQVFGAHGAFTLRNQQPHTLHLMCTVKRSSASDWNSNSARLLASQGALNPTAYSAVCRFFHSFSQGSSVLSSQQLKNFLSVSNVAKVVCLDGPANAKMFPSDYASENSSFTLSNCVQLYTQAASSCPDLFWQDIHKLCTQSFDQSVDGFQTGSDMVSGSSARDILSSSPDYFATLFRALELGDHRISGQVWRLLMSIPTNPTLRRQIMELDKVTTEPEITVLSSTYWESVFDMKSPFRLMYSLQIIQSAISNCEWTDMDLDVMTGLFDENTDDEDEDGGDSSDSASSSSKSSQLGNTAALAANAEEPPPEQLLKCTDWATTFIRAGGFHHLYNVFLNGPALNGNDDVSLFCLALLLKSLLVLANASHAVICNGVSGSDSVSSLFERALPWLRFDDILDRVIQLSVRISSSDTTRSAWSATCAIHFNLQLLKWISLTDPETFYQHLQLESVLAALYSPLVCNVRAIREQMQSTLYVICQQRDEFHSLILDFLQSQLRVIERSPSGQFFSLLKKLLLERFAAAPVSPNKYESLVDRFVQALKVHVSVEQPGTLSSPVTDELLLGIIDILTVLCSSHQSLCQRAGQIGSTETLLNDCLFGIGAPELPKCRSSQTRHAAFTCVSLLCSHSEENLGRALECLFVICSPDSQEQAEEACLRRGWEYEPEKVVRSSVGYTGLVNQGTTCYMNALVSQLFMIPALRNGLIEAVCADEPSPSDTIRNHRILLHQLQIMLANMAISSCAAFDTSGFCGAYTDESGAPIDVRVQQDAQEFFNVLVDRIELALKGSKHENLLKDVFGGRLCNQMLCQGGCGSVRERFEDFSNVSLQVKGFKNLSESLEAYVASEKLSGVECDACGVRTETTLKRVVLDNLPQTLIFHLKRFELNFETFMNEKLNSRFEFPLRINMEPYTKQALSPGGSSSDAHSKSLEYELVGVIIHIGTADAGHYFSYIKDRSASGNVWLEFNDQIVRRFSVDKLGEEAFGGDDNMKNAYMLVYDRIPDRAGTLNETKLEPKIPAALVRDISENNKLFFRDRQLFDPLSMQFIKELLMLPTRNHDQISIRLLARFNLEVVPRSVLGSSDCCMALSVLISHASADFNLSTWILRDFGTRFVLLNDLLLACRDKNIREAFSELLSSCLEKACFHDTPPIISEQTPPPYSESVYDEPCGEDDGYFNNLVAPQTLSQEVVACLLKLVDSCSRHWLRFHQLFSVILRWANSGINARQFLISQAAIARLGHLVLGRDTMLHHFPKHSTVMGNRIVQPDLRAVYSIMGILVRSCYGVNMSRPASSLPGPLSMLGPEDLQILNSELFYERALCMGGDVQGIVDILTHRSWENPQHITPINKMIIEGIVKASAEQVKPYFDLLHGIVQIPDSLQILRIRELMSPENGILFNLKSFSSGHPAFTFVSIRLLLRSIVACEPLAQYMATMRQHCEWMISWMQRYYDQHSYQLNSSLASPGHSTDPSTSSCLTAIELLRRYLQVPFAVNPGDDLDNAISISSSDPDSPADDLNDDAMPADYHYQQPNHHINGESFREHHVPTKPLNGSSGFEGEETHDLSDMENISSDNDTSSVRSTGSIKKRRTETDVDRTEDKHAESHPSLTAVNR